MIYLAIGLGLPQSFEVKRFENNLLNSLGHPVPLVAGLWQSGSAMATILRQKLTDSVGTVVVDLKPLHDAPALQSL